MKKKIKFILIAMIIIVSTILTASCFEDEEIIEKIEPIISHTHSYITKSDEENHWQECECGDKKEVEKHIFDEWKIIKNPTETEEGIRERKCSECYYKESTTMPIKKIGLEYELNSNKKSYSVVGIGTIKDLDLIIPREYNGLPITNIGKSAFRSCNLTSITIPNSVISIGEYAFANCYSLTTITIPNSVTKIEQSTFSWCSNLTTITIPNSVTSIGEWAFSGCISLTNITIPDSVIAIGKDAFFDCYRLVEVYNLSSLVINLNDSDNNGGIGKYVKVIHTSLEEESNFITKGDYVFIKNSNNQYYLIGYKGKETKLVLPNDIEGNSYEINKNCFYRDNGFVIASNQVYTSNSHLYNRSNITSIVIPNSVTNIGERAFDGCYKLVEVYNLSSLDITRGSFDNGFVGQYAKVIHTSLEEKSNFITKDDYLFIKNEENKYYLVAYNGTEKDLVLPANVEGCTYEINNLAFFVCINLEKIVIPSNVTGIEYSAFKGCINLTKVYYEGTLEEWCKIDFKDWLFYPSDNSKHFYLRNGNNEWEEVTSIEIPNTITKIGDKQFAGFDNVTSITIPNGVTRIGNYVFWGCSHLTSIIIPNSVTSIGSDPFAYCRSLKEVYYAGTIAEWNNMTIDSNNFELYSATIYYYSETKPTEEGNYWRYVDGVVTRW